MKKWLNHPITWTVWTVLALIVLPFVVPDRTVPYYNDAALRELALSTGMASVPTTYKGLLEVVDNPENPMSREKIALGKQLFFDNRLSRDKTLNCASCHILESGGDDDRPTAIGFHGRANPFHLNSPTVLNAALAKSQFWNGSAKDVEEQAGGPVQAPFEMNMTPVEVEKRLNADAALRTEFGKVFGDKNITFENVRKAIGAYERTLLTRGAYDDFLDGDDSAISQKAKRGLTLFIDKGCKGCHVGMSVGGQSIQRFPVRRYWSDYIGMIFSPNPRIKTSPYPFEDLGGFRGRLGQLEFRVPILRNITRTDPYFHNGNEKKIEEVVRIMSKYQIGEEFNKEQIDDVVAFLKTLEGEIVVY
jgi:cytochrome c peroxidase